MEANLAKNTELVMLLHRMYVAGTDDPVELAKVEIEQPDFREGIAFFQVGRNATHSFYLGVSEDGTLWKRSYYADYDYDLPYEEMRALWDAGKDEEAASHVKDIVEENIYKAEGPGLGYIGHW